MNAKLSKVAMVVLGYMRRDPEAEFLPINQQDKKAADRLVALGLAERVPGGRQSEYFGLPDPVYRLTESGRTQ
jgi:hypothetical protein